MDEQLQRKEEPAELHVVEGDPIKSDPAQGVGKENEIYTKRFNSDEEHAREETWKVLVEDFFVDYVQPTDIVVDIGAGDGHFLRNVKAARRIAVDLSEHVNELKTHGIEVIQHSATDYAAKLDCKADVIMMSNFLEHLPNKKLLLEVLEESKRALKPGGKLLILQPNIRYVGVQYWDYIDHHIALTEHSIAEALNVTGFELKKMIPRFLPYTAKSLLGRLVGTNNSQKFVRLYLRMPFLWRFLGHQTFVVAAKPE